jgi:hypothetical protein
MTKLQKRVQPRLSVQLPVNLFDDLSDPEIIETERNYLVGSHGLLAKDIDDVESDKGEAGAVVIREFSRFLPKKIQDPEL